MNRPTPTSTACVTFYAILSVFSLASLLIIRTAQAQGAAPASPATTVTPAASSPSADKPTDIKTGNLLTTFSSNCQKKDDALDIVRTCPIFGPIIIPGKFELSRNRDVFGSVAISGFVGFQVGTDIINISPGANRILAGWGVGGFLGFSQNIGGQANAASNATAQNLGATYGVGITKQLGYYETLNSTVHFMILVGFDHVANNQRYQYNDKPWISATFTMGF